MAPERDHARNARPVSKLVESFVAMLLMEWTVYVLTNKKFYTTNLLESWSLLRWLILKQRSQISPAQLVAQLHVRVRSVTC